MSDTTELTADELFDPTVVTSLLRETPGSGVLSIYANADAGSDPGLPGTAIDIRNRLSELGQCRQITQVTHRGNRHIYYSATSLLAYADLHGMHAAAHRIRHHLGQSDS